MRKYPTLFGLCIALEFSTVISAQVPLIINYQGRISTGGATVFDGVGQFKFALVNGGTDLNRHATATAIVSGGFIVGITVSDGGVGYLEAPAVLITDSTGSNAMARASVAAGVVTEIIVTNPGKRYSSVPSITVAPPAPNFAYETYWSNDGTGTGGMEPSAAVTIHVAQGVFSANLGDTSVSNMVVMPPSALTNSDARLRIWFSDGSSGFQQFHPDQRLTTVPFAMVAAKVVDGSVGQSQLAPGAVGGVALRTGAVGTEALGEGVVTASKLAADENSIGKLTGGVISAVGGRININSSFAVGGKVTASAIQGNGAVPWESANDANVQATSNTGYLIESEANVAIDLPSSPATGDVVRVAGKGRGGWRLRTKPGQTVVGNTEIQPGWYSRGPVKNWRSVGCSADGMLAVAAAYDDRIFVSKDGGNTWTATGEVGQWESVVTTDDGRKFIAKTSAGVLLGSLDAGTSWSPRASVPGLHSVACSRDGGVLVALGNNSTIHISTDWGAEWAHKPIILNRPGAHGTISWRTVAVSSTGSRIIASGEVIWSFADQPGVTESSRYIFSSGDSGATWGMHDFSSLFQGIGGVVCSGDGMQAVLSANNLLWRTTDGGNTWARFGHQGDYQAMAMSIDGSRVATVQYQGPLTIGSSDGDDLGVQDFNRQWTSLAISADATRVFGAVLGGQVRIYSASKRSFPIAMTSVSGDANSAIELIYTGDGQFRVLNREGNISY